MCNVAHHSVGLTWILTCRSSIYPDCCLLRQIYCKVPQEAGSSTDASPSAYWTDLTPENTKHLLKVANQQTHQILLSFLVYFSADYETLTRKQSYNQYASHLSADIYENHLVTVVTSLNASIGIISD